MLKIAIPGASPDDLQRGLEAAEAVISAAGVTAERAAEGVFAREGWDAGGFQGEISDEDMEAAATWDKADLAAVEAVCAEWGHDRKRPDTARLEIVDDDFQLLDRETALRLLRESVKAHDGSDFDSRAFILAGVIGEILADPFTQRDLVGDVTVAYTALATSRLSNEPIEPKRQAVLDAIDAIEKAVEMQPAA